MKELTLKELQDFCLNILQEVHEFCENNDIKYSLYAGSMLGAIRHKGYIPWDDDIDIIMPRPDYDRFCKEFRSNNYHLIHAGNDVNCYLAFARVCDLNRTVIETYSPWCSCTTGCWIDIFPADGFPADKDDQYIQYDKCIRLRKSLINLRHAKSHFYGKIWTRIRLLITKVLTLNGYGAVKVVNTLLEAIKTYDYNQESYWASLTNVRDYNEWKHHPIETFATCSLMKFEDRQFRVMDGYDIVLRQRYGDYMKMPPSDEQKPKQSYIHFYWKEK